jgi:tetratricopeptide (TPR) repeat protein
MITTATVQAWEMAFSQSLNFVGDPIATLAEANALDESFVLGPVFCAAYRILGAWSPHHPLITVDVDRAARRADSDTDRAHCEALALLVSGEFGDAADRWDQIAAADDNDLFSTKLAHDLYLHNGDSTRRLQSSLVAIAGFAPATTSYGVVAGELAFGYEELGQYDEAEQWGRVALGVEPGDAWARHALAHVYESQARHSDSLALLYDTRDDWTARPLFAHHLWWHHGLRLWANGEYEAALDVLDRHLTSTTAFGLCDSTSLVWRLELAGVDVSHRWAQLAQHWSTVAERHHSAFVDVHASMVFATVAGRDAEDFWTSLDASHSGGLSENDITFARVVKPLAVALQHYRHADRSMSLDEMSAVLPELHRIGGSAIQRDVIGDTVRLGLAERAEGTS